MGELAMPGVSAYLAHYPCHSATKGVVQGPRALKKKQVKTPPLGNLISGKDRLLPHHWLLFYRGENWGQENFILFVRNMYPVNSRISHIFLLLAPTLVFFSRGKGADGLIHNKNKTYWFVQLIFIRHPVCASHCLVPGISAEQYRKSICLLEIYLLIGETDNKQAAESRLHATKTSTTDQEWQKRLLTESIWGRPPWASETWREEPAIGFLQEKGSAWGNGWHLRGPWSPNMLGFECIFC